MKRLVTGLLVGLGLCLPAAAQDVKELNFGIISTESSAALQKSFGPMLTALEKSVGIPVKAFFAQDYAGVIEGMRFNKVDIAWHGNKSAMGAVDRAGGEVFAQVVKPDGTKGYYTYLIAQKDNAALNSENDVLDCSQGLNFGIGDVNSTSGFLVPTYYLFATNKIDPRTCFKRMAASNHEGNNLAVVNKQVDAAVVSSESLDRLRASRPQDADKVKVLWKSPLIPSDPLVWRKNLPADIKAKVYTFFLSYGRLGTPEEVAAARKVLAGVSDGWGPFIPSSDSQLFPIRQLELFSEKLKVEANSNLSAEDKAKRLQEIDAKLGDLDRLAREIPNA